MAAPRDTLTDEPLFSRANIDRLLQLVADVAHRHALDPAEAIERLEHGAAAAPPRPATASNIRLGEFVDRLRKLRMKRNEALGLHIFRDPAWDMLLDLFAAHERGQKLSVSSLCCGSGVPQTTALRTVQRLEKQGVIEREGDPHDLRRSWVRATPKALSGVATMAGLFAEAVLASTDPQRPAMVQRVRLTEDDLKRFQYSEPDPVTDQSD